MGFFLNRDSGMRFRLSSSAIPRARVHDFFHQAWLLSESKRESIFLSLMISSLKRFVYGAPWNRKSHVLGFRGSTFNLEYSISLGGNVGRFLNSTLHFFFQTKTCAVIPLARSGDFRTADLWTYYGEHDIIQLLVNL